MAEFSWQRHLMARGRYADWVDRGRMRPTHREWTAYLREVAERAEAETPQRRGCRPRRRGRQVAADARGGRGNFGRRGRLHRLRQADHGPRPATGAPARVRRTQLLAAGASSQEASRRERLRDRQRGDGGLDRDQPAEEVTQALDGGRPDQSRGSLFARESYDENRFYSDPGDWPRLAESHRREFLERTDRGVFSMQAEAILNHSRGFRTLAGRAAAIEAGDRQVVVTIEYDDQRERVAYDLVVGRHRLRRSVVRGSARPRRAASARGGGRSRARTAYRRRLVDRRAVAATASAGPRGPRAGARLPEPQLSRPSERPHPAPLRPVRGAGTADCVREERACLRRPRMSGRATTAFVARSFSRPSWQSGSPLRPSGEAFRSVTC